jgi:hypothetical protein
MACETFKMEYIHLPGFGANEMNQVQGLWLEVEAS